MYESGVSVKVGAIFILSFIWMTFVCIVHRPIPPDACIRRHRGMGISHREFRSAEKNDSGTALKT
jgi:hypothetical protein